MKLKFALGLLVATAVAARAAGTAKITYVDHDKVPKGGALVTASDFPIQPPFTYYVVKVIKP